MRKTTSTTQKQYELHLYKSKAIFVLHKILVFFVQRTITEHTMFTGQQETRNVWTIYGVKIHVNEFNTISVGYNGGGGSGGKYTLRM